MEAYTTSTSDSYTATAMRAPSTHSRDCIQSSPKATVLQEWRSKPYRPNGVTNLLGPAERVIGSSSLIGGVRLTPTEIHGLEVLIVEDTFHTVVAAFKQRGALNALTEAHHRGAKVVVAASTGNHGQSVAAAGRELGIRVIVYVPAGTPDFKLVKMKKLGAEVRESESESYDDAAAEAASFAMSAAYTFVHPFDDPYVVAGQATLLSAIVDAAGTMPSVVLVPAGGGGFAAGIVASSMHKYGGRPKVIAVEPARRASLIAALEAGAPIALGFEQTLAQGANVGKIGEIPFKILRDGLHAAVAVDEPTIAAAMQCLFRLGIRAEGAGALTYAALLAGVEIDELGEGPVVAIVSGASIEANDQSNPLIQ